MNVDLRAGDPVQAVVDAVSEHQAALVVMVTRGEIGHNRSALGSVAGGVLQRGNVPFLMVRSRGDPAGVALVDRANGRVSTAGARPQFLLGPNPYLSYL